VGEAMIRQWLSLFGLLVSALLLASNCVARAEDQAERELMIRQQEQRLIQQQEEAEAQRRAAETDKQRATAARREKDKAEAQNRELERSTNTAIDSVGDDLATKLTVSSAIPVLQIGADAAILQGGQDIGISRGEGVRCFRRGNPVIANGQPVGFDEKLIDEGAIAEVREKIAFVQTKSRAPLQVGDVCYSKRAQLGKVAVFPLLFGGRQTRLAEKVSGDLQHALTSRGITLVERDQLTRVLTEQKLGDSDLVDPSEAAHIGALVGADSILLGRFDVSHESIDTVLRVVGAKDGVVGLSIKCALPKNRISLGMLVDPVSPEDVTLERSRRAAEQASLNSVRADAERQLARAEALVTAGLLDEAAEAYVEAVAADPKTPRAQDIGQRIRQATEKQERKTFRALLSQRQQAARELLRTGRYEAADQMLAAALLLAPNDPENLTLADEIRSQGKTTRSIDAINTTIQSEGTRSGGD
jgi:tetratricopeptide (TPR) repeat protein